MASIVFFAGIAAIYLGIPWLIARMIRSVTGLGGWFTVAAFCVGFWIVWQLRTDPEFPLHADQLGGYQNPADCHSHPDPVASCALANASHYHAVRLMDAWESLPLEHRMPFLQFRQLFNVDDPDPIEAALPETPPVPARTGSNSAGSR